MAPTQTQRLYELLKDCRPHRTDEIMRVVYGSDHLGVARIGARVWDVQKKYGVKVDGRHDPEKPSLYWYRMRPVIVPVLPPAFVAPDKKTSSLF
jgi:hypothetical protein